MEIVRLGLVVFLIGLRLLGAAVFLLVGVWRGELGCLLWGLAELQAGGFAIANEFRQVKADRSVDALLIPACYLGTAFVLPLGAGSPAGQAALGLVALGLLFAVGSLGRGFTAGGSTWCGLVDGGPYRFLRHPVLALGLVGRLVVLLDGPELGNLVGFGLAVFFTAAVVQLEERFLLQEAAYREYAARVRFRLLPGVW